MLLKGVATIALPQVRDEQQQMVRTACYYLLLADAVGNFILLISLAGDKWSPSLFISLDCAELPAPIK
jgi:hypothetical protein